MNLHYRLAISISTIAIPIILLIKGIYGSFLFTFSFPLLWEIGFCNQKLASLGLNKLLLRRSIIIGCLSGICLGLIGGNILTFSGITGFLFTDANELMINLGSLKLNFPLDKELSYSLLTKSNSFGAVILYLGFSIIAIGLGEELFWRGFIQKKLSKYTKRNAAVLITAALFSLTHFYLFSILSLKAGLFFLMLIFLVGIIWGYIFNRLGNIWSVAISHGITAFILWKFFFFTSN
jgi:membrane protease YdiL (CAAX protease family)